jgi:hypothetical protein
MAQLVRLIGWALVVALSVSRAMAADKALMLNDNEQAALRHILDVATKAEGIAIAPVAVYFINKLDSAPAVVERKDESKKVPKNDDKEPHQDGGEK